MKIKEYERTKDITQFDLFPVETIAGTRSTAIDDIWWSMANVMPMPNRRYMYRGKNLGSEFTPAQREAIREGTFKDLFIGDYWEVEDVTDPINHLPVKWRIVDLDYGYNTQRTNTVSGTKEECLTHHVIIMPDSTLVSAVYDTSGTKTYGPSQLRENSHKNVNGINTMIDDVFGLKNDGSSRIVSWFHLHGDAVDANGIPTAIYNGMVYIDIPDLTVLFGSTNNPSWQSSTPISGAYNLTYKPFGQFALMAVNPKLGLSTANGSYYMLQDIIGKNSANGHLYAAALSSTGAMQSFDTASPGGAGYVRPMFAIGGED